MKVPVTIIVDVDPKAWRAEYSTGETAEQIRDAVRGQVAEGAEFNLGYLLKANIVKSVERRDPK